MSFATSAINAVELSGNGLSFNTDTFREGTIGTNALAGYIGGMASSFLTTGMQSDFFGYVNETRANADSLARLTGGLTSSAIEYGITGHTKLNVFRAWNTGLIEMNLGGDGKLFNLGTEGTDISAGTLVSSIKGFEAYRQNYRIKESGVDKEFTAAMRTLYSAGMKKPAECMKISFLEMQC